MPREVSIEGVFLPGLAVLLVLALLGYALFDWYAGRQNLYRHVWHPALFRFSLAILVFSLLGLLLY